MNDGGSEDGYDVDMRSDEVLLQQAAGRCDLKFRHQNIREGGKEHLPRGARAAVAISKTWTGRSGR